MVGIQLARRLREVVAVIFHAGIADNERIDAQIERAGRGGVLRSQRVEHKLEVGLALGIALVEAGMSAKELGSRDGYLAIGQRQQINTR